MALSLPESPWIDKFMLMLEKMPPAPKQPFTLPHGGEYGQWGLFIFLVIAGACMGSFLSVCIWRIPRGEDIIRTPSHCPNCNGKIPFFLNVPILGWLLLLGKCARCRTPVSVRYPILELLTCILYTWMWLHLGRIGGDLPLALFWLYLTAMLITVAYIDYDHTIIPDGLNITTAVVALIFAFVWPVSRLGGGEFYNWDLAQEHVITWAVARLLGGTIPLILNNERAFVALDMFLGLMFGGGFLWLLGEVGKKAFGKRHEKADGKPVRLRLTAAGFQEGPEDPVVPWDEIFERETDRLVMVGSIPSLLLKDGSDAESEEAIEINVNWQGVTIDEESFTLEELDHLDVDASEWTVPREAMGMGDVKLMAALGLCIGPGGMLFTLTAGSILGAVLGFVIRMVRRLFRRDDDGMLPFGPYLAAGAILYLLAADPILGAYARVLQRVADMLGR